MPVTYEIDPVRNLIRTTCFGNVRLQDVMAHFDELQRDPHRPDRLDVLLDLRDMDAPPQAPQLQAVADRVGLVEGLVFGACAIVAKSSASTPETCQSAKMGGVFAKGSGRALVASRSLAIGITALG